MCRWHILICLFLLLHHSIGQLTCDNAICNNEGVCVWENNETKCNCLQSIYTGKTCDELVDYCLTLPCKNGGSCRYNLCLLMYKKKIILILNYLKIIDWWLLLRMHQFFPRTKLSKINN